ncbi:LPS translocon maturation chaperone LptM [Thiococcus pfennigii]|jgi:predicted small lipoprotein YifL|uniref:LPS translocon maturation chaperone LptM n=1 Tax=Thiococcus pfennigii TaxID=1057 RepID=UPI00190753EC|nr:lipoprotein [Thiococcus pfennigii]MBK1702317.1 hypothetical protein [Thiococcus pfennigii]MBK1730667.1 hypothetical protein [Thiococcus pfennigii]
MHCWARYLFIAVVMILGVGSIVTACGQKGDLYLPDPAEDRAERLGAATDLPPVPPPAADATGR